MPSAFTVVTGRISFAALNKNPRAMEDGKCRGLQKGALTSLAQGESTFQSFGFHGAVHDFLIVPTD